MSTTTNRPVSEIAREIRKDWGAKVNYAAKPHLDVMLQMTLVTDAYGQDSPGESILRFLSNASSWRGDNAKRIKAELKKMVGLK